MTPTKLFGRLVTQTAIAVAFMAAVLFGAAGDWHWPQARAFIVIFLGATVGFAVFLWRRDPGLLAERLSSPVHKDQPKWDRVFLLCAMTVWHLWLALMALDAVRFHWSQMPVWLSGAGAILIVAGFAAILPVFAANSFAAPVVRVQSERKQHLIDTGPYAVVRHPMYAAALIYLVGMPLLLGSWWGLAVLPLLIVGLAQRMRLEEKTLSAELDGYAGYMTRVRWRLVPHLW